MPKLKYYKTEREEFKDAFDFKLNDNQVNLFYHKLQTKYKFKQYLIRKGRLGCGKCNSYRIIIGENTSIGVLAHEVAHAIQYKQNNYYMKGMRFHTKKHKVIMGRLINYINRHQDKWLESENKKQEKKLTLHQNKEKNKQELKDYKKTNEFKIKKLMEKENKLLSRLKRTNTILKKVQRKIKYYNNKVI